MNQNVNEATKALAKLAEGADGKSETSKLRAVIDQIEVALAAGVRRAAILETLRPALGINMNLNTFQRSLYRIRKERRKKEGQRANAIAQTAGTGHQSPPAVAANPPNHLPVLVGPAPPPLYRGNLPMKQRLAESRKETGKTLDEGDFIDEYDYENSGEDKHESSSS